MDPATAMAATGGEAPSPCRRAGLGDPVMPLLLCAKGPVLTPWSLIFPQRKRDAQRKLFQSVLRLTFTAFCFSLEEGFVCLKAPLFFLAVSFV